jgi:hypothetical protein
MEGSQQGFIDASHKRNQGGEPPVELGHKRRFEQLSSPWSSVKRAAPTPDHHTFGSDSSASAGASRVMLHPHPQPHWQHYSQPQPSMEHGMCPTTPRRPMFMPPPRRRRSAERAVDTCEHALELFKRFRESGKDCRQEASFEVPALGTVTVFYHKVGRPLKGIVVNGGASSFSTFSKFRDWAALRLEGDAGAALGAPTYDGDDTDGEGEGAPMAMPHGASVRRAVVRTYEFAARGALRTPSPQLGLMPGTLSDQCVEGRSAAAATLACADALEAASGGHLAEVYDASAVLLQLCSRSYD